MNKEEKNREVGVLKERFQSAKTVIFSKNVGLKVSELTELRKKLRREKASIKVIKNRLLKRALEAAQIKGLDSFLEGPTMITTSETDPVVSAKLLVDFIKDQEIEKLVIKGGYLEGEILSVEKIKALAKLPSKDELYAMLLRCCNAPATGLVNVLAAFPRQLATVLDAIRKQKQS